MSKKFYTGRLAYESEFVLKLEVLGSDVSVLSGLCEKKQVTTFQILSETKTDKKANFKMGKSRFFYYYIQKGLHKNT